MNMSKSAMLRAFAILEDSETARDARSRLRSEVVTDDFVRSQSGNLSAETYVNLLMRAYVNAAKDAKATMDGLMSNHAPSNMQWV